MKTTHILKTVGLVSAFSFSSLAFVSCDDDDDDLGNNNGSTPTIVEIGTSFEFILDTTSVLGPTVEPGESVISDGVTFSFTAINTANGAIAAAVEDNGLLFSNQTFPASDVNGNDINTFSFTVDSDVRIVSYTLGLRENVDGGRSFSIAGSSTNSGENSIPEGTATEDVRLSFQPGTISYLRAGEVYTFSSNLDPDPATDSLGNLRSIEVIRVEVTE